MQITAEIIELELARTFTIARGATDAEPVLVVRLDDGAHVGLGEGAEVDYAGERLDDGLAFVLDRAAGVLAAAGGTSLEAVLGRLVAAGAPRSALMALDGALHDLTGKQIGRPTWELLGLERTGPATSFTLGIDTVEGTLDRLADARGYRHLKIKVGGRHDEERLRAIAGATDQPLRIDGNQGWDIDQARELMPLLVELGVELLEQPFPTEDAEAYHAVAAMQRRVPVILDEACDGASSVPACARLGDGINVKLSKTGGIREALRTIHTARAHGLSVMLGCMNESELGIAQAAQLGSLADWNDLDGHLLLRSRPFTGLELHDGVVVPGDRPGLGIEPAGVAA